MTLETSPAAPIEPDVELAQMLAVWNDRLVAESSRATTRAFNLGCFVGLLPASIVVLLTFILTNFSWVGAFTMAILMVLGLILFANVAAGYAHTNTSRRIFHQEIKPEIKRTLTRLDFDQGELIKAAKSTLPEDAPLRGYIAPDSAEA
jgi:hypothetical protein